MQLQMIAKDHGNVNYSATIYRYTQEFAIQFTEHCTFICTDNKHKISIGESGTPFSVLPRGKRVLVVVVGEYFRVTNHNCSLVSIIPTIILLNDICIYLKKLMGLGIRVD